MSSLFQKIWNKLAGLKSKEMPAINVYSKDGKIIRNNYWHEHLNISGEIRNTNLLIKPIFLTRWIPDFKVFNEDLHQKVDVQHLAHVYYQYLKQSETEGWIQILQGEEKIPSKIRYTQKLLDIDRRMRVLEQEKQIDKEIRLGQTRQLEYLEADVDLLKKRDRALLDQSGDVGFTEDIKSILENVRLMKEMRDEPAEFEQVRATFLSQVRRLESQKKTREPYFADLLTMIDVGLTYADETELKEESFAVLRDAVKCISSEVTSDILREFRKQFRDTGINILKPLDPQASIGELLKETFK